MSEKYKFDTKFEFTLSIGFPGAKHRDDGTIGELLGYPTQEDWDKAALTDEEVEENLDEVLKDWSSNYIETNWSVE